MSWLLFVVFVYVVLTVREIVCALGVVGCCFLAVTIGVCWWRAGVSVPEDIDEPSYPGTSQFLRQLRLDDAKSKVPRAKGPADDDEVAESSVVAGPIAPAPAPATADDEVTCASAVAGPIAPASAADDDAVAEASVVAGPIELVPAADDDAVTGATAVEEPSVPAAIDDDAVAGVPVAVGPAVPAAADEGSVVVPVAADKGADNEAEIPLPRTTVDDDAGGDDSEDAAPHFLTNEAWLISNPRADIYSLRIDTSPHIIVSPLFEYADPSDIYEDADILLRELRAHTSEDESSPIQRIIDNVGAQYDNPSHVCEGLARALDRLANRFQACGIHSEQPAEPVATEVATEQAKSVGDTSNVKASMPSVGSAPTTDTTEGRKAKRAGKTKNCAPTKGADGTKTIKSRAEKVGGNRTSSSKARANKVDGGDKSTSKPHADKVCSSEGSASMPGAEKAAGDGKSYATSCAHNSSDGSANAPHDIKAENILTSGSNKVQPKAPCDSVPAASSASTEPEVLRARSSSSSGGVTASTPTGQHEVPVISAGADTQVPAIPEASEKVGGPTAVGATSPLVASHASGTRVLFASTPVLPVLPRASASEKGKAPDRSNADTVDTSSTVTVNHYETTRVYIPEVSSSKWYMKLFKNAGSQLRRRFDTDVVLQDDKQTIADGTKQEAEPLSSTGALHAVAPPVADAEMEEVKPPVADTETDKEPPTDDLDTKEPPVADAEGADAEMEEADADMEEPPAADADMEEAEAPVHNDVEMEDADAEMDEEEVPAHGNEEMEEVEVEVHVPVLDAAAVEAGMLILGRAHIQPRKRRLNRAPTGTLPLNCFGLEAGGLPFNQGYPQANNAPLAGTVGGTINVPTFTSGLDTLAWISGTSGEYATLAHTLGQAAPGPLPDVSHIDFSALAQGCANAGTGNLSLAGSADTLADIPATLSAEAIAVMRDITRQWYANDPNVGEITFVDNPGATPLGGNPGTVPPQPNANDAQPYGGEFDDLVNAIEADFNNDDARNAANISATGDNILFVDNSGNYVYQQFNNPNDVGNLPAADAMGNVVPTFDHNDQDVENTLHLLNGLSEPVRDQYINQAPQFALPAMPVAINAGVGYTAFGDNVGVGALPFDINGMPVAENNLRGGALGPLFPGAYALQPLNQIGGDLWQNTPSNDFFAELDRLAALPQSTAVPVVPAIPG
ncbi:hypothetical protein H4S07_000659 [Coemansia furcata]|uniref:Uncharacterized protein n=1 Tax=Coemansia furcata TaxID=417177 RepID=A0ACC1LQK6_9FUNG|nr:hypothetical protein H4S07_000659 [Coemansia furcata]